MRCAVALPLVALLAALASGASAQAPATDPYGNYHGTWRGSFLLSGGDDDGAAGAASPRVHAGSFEIAADGVVRGSLPEGGCSLAGSSTAFVSAANASIDVTLSGCRDTRFNGRFRGRLINNPLLKYASLRLGRAAGASSEGGAQVSAIVRH